MLSEYNKKISRNPSSDNYDDVFLHHITNLARVVGSSFLGSIDRYIINMIETRDGRRALIDRQNIERAAREIEKEYEERAYNGVIKGVDSAIKQLQM